MYYIRRGGENKGRREVHLCNVGSSIVRLRSPLFVSTRLLGRPIYPVDRRLRDKSTFRCFNISSTAFNPTMIAIYIPGKLADQK